jgi:catechol 2,3-dioxygenase-like lactoylglutathione lyase family enzyme
MAINGIKQLRYGVEDMAAAVRFFTDFGLPVAAAGGDEGTALFELPNGSSVEILPLDHPSLPSSSIEGPGVREVIWGVNTREALSVLVDDISRDHDVKSAREAYGFVPSFGIPMALSLWSPFPIVNAPDPNNAPGFVNRLNTHRKWRRHARPKIINHVVFRSAAPDEAATFMRTRLGFRLSDIQKGFGHYLRADGSNNHHNLLLLDARAPYPGWDGKTRFDHANFGVEDIDELMIGVNSMLRKGWGPSRIGLGRHRIDSALFYYLNCPAGGEAEYGADADFVDDNWVPRIFHVPLFAYSLFTHNIPEFLREPPEWSFSYLTDEQIAEGLMPNAAKVRGDA